MQKPLWRERCLKHPGIMFGKALRNARTRAKERSVPFEITREYIYTLFENQDGKCYYSGMQLSVVKNIKEREHDPLKMTLDCVDPKLGYVAGNIVWCAYCINALKLQMSEAEMLNICSEIVTKTTLRGKVL